MKPRDAVVKIHHKRKYPYAMSCDGNTPIYETVEEIELVNARVWPVSMGPDEMLVEYEDGMLGAVKLEDIRLGNRS